jgi:methylated-DNA-[protein]-cysteine S-methyltransferase
MSSLVLNLEHVPTPIGTILLLTDGQDRLRALDWQDYEARMQRLLRLHYRAGTTVSERRSPSSVRRRLEAYFGGELSALDSIIVETGGTEFQRSVWRALRDIRPGATMSYGALADRIGRPRAVRAVGLANGSNPIGIVVPCHRVIGANASLTGYAGGLERKAWLLRHERSALTGGHWTESEMRTAGRSESVEPIAYA